MNQTLMNNLAQPVNHVAQAYEARTNQLTQQREADEAKAAAAQQQRDNDMLKVFELVGDGRIEEAKYLAQAKGLDVPEQIYQNGDFAKGLATAGNFYGNDPAGAQRFTMAWMQTQDIPDYGQRVIQSSRLAGQPIDPEDRKFQQQLRLEQFKADLKSTGRREDLFIDTTKEAFGNIALTPDEMKGAGSGALEAYDQAFPRTQPSAGLVNYGTAGGANQPLNVRNNNPGNMRPVGATSGFQQFGSPQEGMQAMRNDLAAKISGQSQAMASRFGANYYGNAGQQAQNPQSLYQEASMAISMGAPKEAVYARLQEMGLDPSVIQQQEPTAAPVQPPQISMVNQGGSGYNPNTGYFYSVPEDSRFDRISKGLANFTNIPAHIRNTVNAGGSALRTGVNFVADTAVNTVEGVGDYLSESPYVMVTAPNGQSGYIPRQQLQQALSEGYKTGFDDGRPSVPIAQ